MLQSLLAQSCIPPSLKPPSLRRCNRDGSKFGRTFANKKTVDTSTKDKEPVFALKLSKVVVYRSAIAIFGLGFLDAGYSGDWSRIGAISAETEELLKVSAYIVLPLCVLLAAIISDEDKS